MIEDTRQHKGKHEAKHEWFSSHGVERVRRKLDFGDYMREGSNYSVDTKASVDEVAQNINGKSHARFKREMERARDAGCVLVVLVENTKGYKSVNDVRRWTNTHCVMCGNRMRRACVPMDPHGKCMKHGTMKPIQGPRLARAMKTMEGRYGVRFEFCSPDESAQRICDILGVSYERDAESGS